MVLHLAALSFFDSRQIGVCHKVLVGHAEAIPELPRDSPAQGVEHGGEGKEINYFWSPGSCLPCRALQDVLLKTLLLVSG